MKKIYCGKNKENCNKFTIETLCSIRQYFRDFCGVAHSIDACRAVVINISANANQKDQ
jgi:hypothetical protein